ncbi:MAG: SET domain-containing protein-lysine N-methyltransferase [Erysipelotrichia bacterium]|nr:SET domain-containing protein-lysine N-methyltransferase [Erysipelotrichia bacterium]
MIHPWTELRFINNEIGYGVVATRFIPKGTITWAFDKLDREFTQNQVDLLAPMFKEIMDKYCFRNSKGNHILCWDNGRYVNHSFHSNCMTTPYDYEIAIRDIKEGEELTDDYGYLNIDEPFRGIDEGTRRKIVYPDDLVKYHKTWDKQLIKAMKNLSKVEQPLQPLLTQETWEKSVRISEGREEMDSILNCYYGERNIENHEYKSTNLMMGMETANSCEVPSRHRHHHNR